MPPRHRAPLGIRPEYAARRIRNYHDIIMTLPRRLSSSFAVVPLATLCIACGNNSARAPNPTGYDWPDAFRYRVEYVAVTERDTQPVARYEEAKLLQLAVRDDRFLVWHDSLRKVSALREGPPTDEPPRVEDTLHYYVRLGRLGEITGSEPGCDPVLPACREAPLSALPIELRHLVPRLPIWWPPKGYEWEDTLAFDDAVRGHGARGSLITYYRASRDTLLAGRGYWIVTWHSVRRSFRSEPSGAIVADQPVEESGSVYVDKQLLLPAYAGWFGAVAAPPGLRAMGVTGTGFRGRAVLVGSAFDSLRAREEAR